MGANNKQVGGDHYKTGEIQHWDYAWVKGFDQFQYCITKYVERHKRKNGLEDLRKAQHHLEKYIELLEKEQKPLEKIKCDNDTCPICNSNIDPSA